MSICDYFTKTLLEYLIDHVLDIVHPCLYSRDLFDAERIVLHDSRVGESAGCARTNLGKQSTNKGR